MKKYFYPTLMMLAMMVAALSFTACGGDDEEDGSGNTSSSALVGTWELVSTTDYYNGKVENTENGDEYWVITKDNITIHSTGPKSASMDGLTLTYTYDERSKTLDIVAGYPLYKITTLSSSALVLQSEEQYGSYEVRTFKKK